MRLWIFLLAEGLFDLGQFVFFVLFNLYLIDRGFDESLLGLVVAAQTVGSLCGTLPGGWLVARAGLGRALRLTFAAASILPALQAWAGPPAAVLALAFASGTAGSLRAVALLPAVAQLSTGQTRPRAFSWFSSIGIGMGVAGGLLGGKLPGWTARAWTLNPAGAKQAALWAGCAIAAASLLPLLGLHFDSAPAAGPGARIYPRTPFVRRYFAAAFIWYLFMGAFSPFFNAYFARRYGAGAMQVGTVLSFSQLTQVAALSAAPALFSRIGLERGVAVTQAAAALLLGSLAASRGLLPAATLYCCYTAAQWMSGPGLQSLLMDKVKPQEQGGASAVNFFLMFGAQAAATALFGQAVPRFGYPAALSFTAVIGLAAACVFLRLLGRAAVSTALQTSSQ